MATSMVTIAARAGVSKRYVSRLVRLALLAPELVERIVPRASSARPERAGFANRAARSAPQLAGAAPHLQPSAASLNRLKLPLSAADVRQQNRFVDQLFDLAV